MTSKLPSKKPLRVLIAVITCENFRQQRADHLRSGWVSEVQGADVRFFIGGQQGATKQRQDEVILDCSDTYKTLPQKVRAMCQWALDEGIDYVFRCDDDVYCRPERLLASGFENHDYIGRLRGPSGGFPHPYASGFSYWLSRRAMYQIVKYTSQPKDSAEDRWVAGQLLKGGIECHPDYRYRIIKSATNAISGNDGPRQGNDIISVGEMDFDSMRKVHNLFLTQPVKTKQGNQIGPFDGISILLKTFLRDGHLYETIDAIEANLPGAKMIIVDDGYESKRKITTYAALRDRGHTCVWLPFDSGFCAKANEGVKHLDREFLLIGSDDFDFTPRAAEGVLKMMTVLRHDQALGMASGRVDGVPYEGNIEMGERWIREHPLEMSNFEKVGNVEYKKCDLTVNYGLVRNSIFADGKCRWADYKIGGDHFEWFYGLKQAGWQVAYVRGVNIRQQRPKPGYAHEDYGKYRARAGQALPTFFAKFNIDQYICFDGRADVRENGAIVSKQLFPDTRVREAPLIESPLIQGNFYRVNEPLYMSSTGNVVPRSFRGSKVLLFRQNTKISVEMAQQYGLLGE